MTDPKRVTFRVPAGWTVDHHEWHDVDPSTLADGDPAWDYLQEDLAQIHHEGRGLLVDVGWYPSGRAGGNYSVIVLAENDWNRPIERFVTNSLRQAISRLEELLETPPPVPFAQLLELLSSTSPEVRARAALALGHQGHVEAMKLLTEAYAVEKDPKVFDAMQVAVRSLALEKKRRDTGD